MSCHMDNVVAPSRRVVQTKCNVNDCHATVGAGKEKMTKPESLRQRAARSASLREQAQREIEVHNLRHNLTCFIVVYYRVRQSS